MLPLVSICIPAYNCGKFIENCLHSLLKQTYQNFEIIVVDDGSTDDTEKIVRGISDTRIHFISQQNSGASAARNAAFLQSKGEYIKFMDADDLLGEESIQAQVKAIAGSKTKIASGKWGRFYLDDVSDFKLVPEKVWKNMTGIDWLVESLIEHGSNMTQPGIFLIPRDLINKTGLWDESLSLIDDFEFMTRIITACSQMVFCEQSTLLYRGGRSDSLSVMKSDAHLTSAYKSQLKGIEILLRYRNDERCRLACANSLQLWAYLFYSTKKQYYQKFDSMIAELGGSTVKPQGSFMYLTLQRILGVKTASGLRRILHKYKYKNKN